MTTSLRNNKTKLISDDLLQDEQDTTSLLEVFSRWLNEATGSEVNDANAMNLATVDGSGLPNSRIVLLKSYDERGFVFYTNYESNKGNELKANAKAALGFHWKSLGRQIRIRGNVEKVSAEEADRYFQTRPRSSQLGAWASAQSRPLDERSQLDDALLGYDSEFAKTEVTRPAYWSGFRVVPLSIEFWLAAEFRVHDRVQFSRAERGSESWKGQRLYP